MPPVAPLDRCIRITVGTAAERAAVAAILPEALGALASLRDPEFVARVVTEVAAGREEYARLAASLGLVALPSATNFAAIDVGGGDRARALLDELEARGVFSPHAAGSAP